MWNDAIKIGWCFVCKSEIPLYNLDILYIIYNIDMQMTNGLWMNGTDDGHRTTGADASMLTFSNLAYWLIQHSSRHTGNKLKVTTLVLLNVHSPSFGQTALCASKGTNIHLPLIHITSIGWQSVQFVKMYSPIYISESQMFTRFCESQTKRFTYYKSNNSWF